MEMPMIAYIICDMSDLLHEFVTQKPDLNDSYGINKSMQCEFLLR